MAEITKVALDAMGGDNAPVRDGERRGRRNGKQEKNVKVFSSGKGRACKIGSLINILMTENRIEIVNATEVIETAEPPVNAIRKKKDSSIVVGMKMVKSRRGRCFCVCRQFRSNSCRRSDIGRPNQGCGADRRLRR